jgi:hypothetical protein
MRTVLSLGLLALSVPTFAQDLDAPAADESDGKRRARNLEGEVVREVVRGFYLKSNIGSAALLPFTPVPGGMSGVMDLGLGIGADFIDRERFSAAWEAQFSQSLFNGPPPDALVGVPVVEGDIHTFSGVGVIELSGYISRRTGFGLRGGGGVMFAPVLVTDDVYNGYVANEWGGAQAAMHAGPLPMALVGATFEYYTKLSHFSIGADVDAEIVIPHALGFAYTGYLKYTF